LGFALAAPTLLCTETRNSRGAPNSFGGGGGLARAENAGFLKTYFHIAK
jgi:hypothetical protein